MFDVGCVRSLPRPFGGPIGLALIVLLAGTWARAEAPAPATRPTRGPVARAAASSPRNLQDLKAVKKQVEEVVKKATPATVGVLVGGSQGSGVIVSKDGYVLTAGHVAGEPGKDVLLVLPDGKRIKAKTLGVNRGIDSGMIRITQDAPEGGWPFVETGKSADLKPGQWVVSLGHPGGYQKGRPPVVRLGRVLTVTNSLVGSDCTLVGGDSGGPLFDLDGHLVGIHSRIGPSTLANIHVPVDTFTDTWDRLAKGEAWGDRSASSPAARCSASTATPADKGFKVATVTPDSPAAKAGLKVDDVITKMDGKPVAGLQGLADAIVRHKAGDKVKLEVLRGKERVELKATLAKRPE